MASYRLKPDDVAPLLEGLTILGTGGGGSPEWGRAILENDFTRGRELVLLDPDDVPDEALVVSGGIMGSVKSWEHWDPKALVERWEERFELMEACRLMERHLERKVDFVVPFEVGGLNTPVVMSWAARLGTACIDGDGLGRSAPETQMSSFLTHGYSLTPMPLVDANGNAVMVVSQCAPTYADEIGRWVVTHGGSMGANNHYPMSGVELKKAVIPGTISLALRIGRALQAARGSGQDPVEAVAEVMGADRLFCGRVSQVQGEDVGGFYITNVTLHGTGADQGMEAKLLIKNETMALWLSGRLKAVFPDLVCMLHPSTGGGIQSIEVRPGLDMVLVGAPCHPRLREGLDTELGRAAFGGYRYGHAELEYAPIEDLR